MRVFQANNVGEVIVIAVLHGCGIADFTTASNFKVHFKSPSGAVVTRSANVIGDPSEGKFGYVTTGSDGVNNEVGMWEMQGEYQHAGWHGRIGPERYLVLANL